MDHIAALMDSSESQQLNETSQITIVKSSLRQPPPLWKILWSEVACIVLRVITLIDKLAYSRSIRYKLEILNYFVAFFTAIAKACFMIPVSVAISHAQQS